MKIFIVASTTKEHSDPKTLVKKLSDFYNKPTHTEYEDPKLPSNFRDDFYEFLSSNLGQPSEHARVLNSSHMFLFGFKNKDGTVLVTGYHKYDVRVKNIFYFDGDRNGDIYIKLNENRQVELEESFDNLRWTTWNKNEKELDELCDVYKYSVDENDSLDIDWDSDTYSFYTFKDRNINKPYSSNDVRRIKKFEYLNKVFYQFIDELVESNLTIEQIDYMVKNFGYHILIKGIENSKMVEYDKKIVYEYLNTYSFAYITPNMANVEFGEKAKFMLSNIKKTVKGKRAQQRISKLFTGFNNAP